MYPQTENYRPKWTKWKNIRITNPLFKPVFLRIFTAVHGVSLIGFIPLQYGETLFTV